MERMHIMDNKYFLSMYEKAVPDDLPFKEKLMYCKKFGFDGLEISIDASDWRIARLDWNQNEKNNLLKDIKDTGVPIYSMCLSAHRKYPMGSLNEEIHNKSMYIMNKAIDFACDLGIRIIQIAGYDEYENDSTELTESQFIKSIKMATELASKKGVLLGFETMDTEFLNTVEKGMKYVDIVDSPYLNMYPDIGNLKNAAIMYNKDVNEDIKKGKNKIIAAHLKETIPGHDRGIPFGEGHTEFLKNIVLLKNMGVRYFNGEFWCEGDDWINKGIESNLFLRKWLDTAFNNVL